MALSWFFKDERTGESVAALRSVKQFGALVPALWSAEVVHVLVKAEKRGRLRTEQTATALDYLRALPISVEAGGSAPSFAALALVRRFDLSAYDAAYLEVAVNFSLPLATRDDRLASAAGTLGLRWLARRSKRSH